MVQYQPAQLLGRTGIQRRDSLTEGPPFHLITVLNPGFPFFSVLANKLFPVNSPQTCPSFYIEFFFK